MSISPGKAACVFFLAAIIWPRYNALCIPRALLICVHVAVVEVWGMISALMGLVLFCCIIGLVFSLAGSGFFLYLGGFILSLFATWVLFSAIIAP